MNDAVTMLTIVTTMAVNVKEEEELLFLAIEGNDEHLQRLHLIPDEGRTTYVHDLPRFNLDDLSHQHPYQIQAWQRECLSTDTFP